MPDDMPQVWIEWTRWETANQTATELLPDLEEGPVSGWWFIRKHPCWRLRYCEGPGARAHLDQALTALRDQGKVESWTHGVYEPEQGAFGGRLAMDLAHQLFHNETRHLLHRAARTGHGELGNAELAVMMSSVFLRAVGLDWYEQGDVWSRVCSLRNRPEPFGLDPVHTRQVRILMTVSPHPLTQEAGPLRNETALLRDLTDAGQGLADLHRRGMLTRGLRAVCAHHLIFSFNRWGLSHWEQHILSNTAREIVMTDTTTPTTEAIDHARNALADQLCTNGHITSPAVEDAFRTVPRHLFVPNASLEDAYANRTVSIKDDEQGHSLSCASQPSIVAMMLEQSRIEPGMRVLELGTGTGYNAGLIAHIVGEKGHVVTIDVDQDLTDNATDRLREAAVDNVEVVLGDGALGHEGGAPYDRIIATVGSHRVPAAWVTQLAPGGLLIAPVRVAGDASYSIVFQRDGDKLISVDHQLSTFMPLRDSVDGDTRSYMPITDDDTVMIQVNRDQKITSAQVKGVLDEPAKTVWTGITIGGMEPREGLWLRLAVTLDNSLSRMLTKRSAIESGLVTPGLPWGDMASVPTHGRGLAYLTGRPLTTPQGQWEFGVISHSQDGHELADRMAAVITGWDRKSEASFELHLDNGETTLRTLWY